MKRCPKCSLSYSDETLEFCLEDGAKLIFTVADSGEIPTVLRTKIPVRTTEKTVNLPFPEAAKPLDAKAPNQINTRRDQSPEIKTYPTGLNEQTTLQAYKALEISPIIISLAHNWWQWVYLNNQSYYSFSSYFLSANFAIWLLLLCAGVATGLLAIKYCASKAFSYTSLVILAINLLLFLVPKR